MRSTRGSRPFVEGRPRAGHNDAEPPRIDPMASRRASERRWQFETMIGERKRRGRTKTHPRRRPHPHHHEGHYCGCDGGICGDESPRIPTAVGSIRLVRRPGAVAVAAAAAASSSYLATSIVVASVVTWTSLPNASLASSTPVAELGWGCLSSRRPAPRPSPLGMPTGVPPGSRCLGVISHSPKNRRRRRGHRAVVDPFLLSRGGGGDDESLRPPPPPSSIDDDVGVDESISTVGGESGEEAPRTMTTPLDPESLPDGGWEGGGGPSERTSSVLLTTPHRWMPAVSVALREVVVGDHRHDDGDDDSSETTAVATMATAEPVLVTKFELSRRLGCPLRDLRIVDPKYGGATAVVGAATGPPSSTSTMRAVGAAGGRQHSNTAFLPRRGGVVVHVGAVRAVVMEREVLLFGLPHPAPSPTTSPIGAGAHAGTDVDMDGLVGFLLDHLNSVFGEAGNVAEPREEGGGSGGGRRGASGRRAATTRSSPQRQPHDYRKRAQRPQRGEEGSPSPPPPPFELVVIEAILSYVCTEEAERAAAVIATAREVLEGIEGGPSGWVGGDADVDVPPNGSRKKNKKAKKASFMSMQSRLGQLLPLKNRLDEMEANCAEVASAIVDVLRSDEDMEAMILSRRLGVGAEGAGGVDAHHPAGHQVGGSAAVRSAPHHHSSTHHHSSNHHHGRRAVVQHPALSPAAAAAGGGHAEVELLFEDFLLRMEEVLYSLRSVQSAVRNTEEVVEIELDVMRNRILRYELLLESSAFAVGCGAAITGLFGMNLVSHYEDHAKMFYYVTAFIVVLMAGIGFGIVSQLEIYNIW